MGIIQWIDQIHGCNTSCSSIMSFSYRKQGYVARVQRACTCFIISMGYRKNLLKKSTSNKAENIKTIVAFDFIHLAIKGRVLQTRQKYTHCVYPSRKYLKKKVENKQPYFPDPLIPQANKINMHWICGASASPLEGLSYIFDS